MTLDDLDYPELALKDFFEDLGTKKIPWDRSWSRWIVFWHTAASSVWFYFKSYFY